MFLVQIDQAGYYLRHIEHEEGAVTPTGHGWIRAEPPADPEANNLWTGAGWIETAERPEAAPWPEVISGPVTRLVSKSLWLANALFFAEKREFARWGIRAGELTSADFDSADPDILKVTYWAAFLVDFNGLGEFIDLADQKVIEGVFLFVNLAGLTTDRGFEILEWEG